ncbi:MAG: PD-(D/E)XK nuclease family protein [Caldilineaceae bacterium]
MTNQPTTPSPTLQLPVGFAFSQSSLQAYEDCPRRFWLTYVQQLPWPALEASPIQEHERLMRLGEAFHRLVERSEIGMEGELLAANLERPLADWFNAYLRQRPRDLPTEYLEVEKVVSIADPSRTSFGMRNAASDSYPPVRLAAKYDLIAAESNGRVVIIDWKTARRRTDPATLRRRVQSWVYPFVLVEASDKLPFGPLRPEQVEMRYWFTAAPSQPVVFRYDAAQHEENRQKLTYLLQKILAGTSEAEFPRIPDTEQNRKRFCDFCIYRSRCNRGVFAGDLEELMDDEQFYAVDLEKALEFTLQDVGELAF